MKVRSRCLDLTKVVYTAEKKVYYFTTNTGKLFPSCEPIKNWQFGEFQYSNEKKIRTNTIKEENQKIY